MADFGHTKMYVNWYLLKQYCYYYYGAPIWDLQSKCIGTCCIA